LSIWSAARIEANAVKRKSGRSFKAAPKLANYFVNIINWNKNPKLVLKLALSFGNHVGMWPNVRVIFAKVDVPFSAIFVYFRVKYQPKIGKYS
jgi:hypothetical protein